MPLAYIPIFALVVHLRRAGFIWTSHHVASICFASLWHLTGESDAFIFKFIDTQFLKYFFFCADGWSGPLMELATSTIGLKIVVCRYFARAVLLINSIKPLKREEMFRKTGVKSSTRGRYQIILKQITASIVCVLSFAHLARLDHYFMMRWECLGVLDAAA